MNDIDMMNCPYCNSILSLMYRGNGKWKCEVCKKELYDTPIREHVIEDVDKAMIITHDEAKHDCFNCAYSFVDENDKLHCMCNDGKIVADEDSCDDWN